MPKKLHLILLIFAIIAAIISLSYVLYSPEEKSAEQFFYGAKDNPLKILERRNKNLDPLIQAETAKLKGKYAVYVKDLTHNEVYELNSQEIFGSASIYKLAVMYKAFDAIEKGEIKKTDVLSQNVAVLDQALTEGQEGEEVEGGTVSYTVENALKLMITISDNYSALLLAERFGWANIDKFMESEGFGGFNLVGADSPNVTARAAGELLEKIYRNKAVSHLYSEEMKNLLFAQTINDRIPKYLPEYAKVGHKTGELDTVRHDAGIVLGKKGDYIFVILSDTPQPGEAPENIAQLSKKIFDELEK